MKTREVTLWFNGNAVRELINNPSRKTWFAEVSLEQGFSEYDYPVIINLPDDPKVEITESEFDQVWTTLDLSNSKGIYSELKQKLFSK